ncbi:MAG: hypothetical protein ACKVT0_05305 [Planctomycetaceae bacterium]
MNSLATNPETIPRKAIHPGKVSIARQCLSLAIGMLALWAVLYYPADRFAGSRGVEGLTYAGLLCLIPGLVALILSGGILNAGANAGQGALISTGMRLMTVGLAAIFMQSARPDLRFWQFHVWLILFYLASLIFETCFILKGVHRKSA